jgi:hypothetical protein
VQGGFAHPEQLTQTFVREAKRLAAQGAEVILAACATVNAVISRERIREVDGALILDANAVLLKVTEGMAELAHSIGLQASRRLLYRQPGKGSIEQWMQVYGLRASPVTPAERRSA